MKRALATLVITLTINAAPAFAAQIGATPCASEASVHRAIAAMHPYLQWQTSDAPSVAGMVLLDCLVQPNQRLRCTAPHHTQSPYDIGAAAVAFASELEVCPGTPRHVMFPLRFRDETSGAVTPSPSP